MKSNGSTFYIPAALQLRRGEDFARGMRSDVIDYHAMLAREYSGRSHAGCYERPAQYVNRVTRNRERT